MAKEPMVTLRPVWIRLSGESREEVTAAVGRLRAIGIWLDTKASSDPRLGRHGEWLVYGAMEPKS